MQLIRKKLFLADFYFWGGGGGVILDLDKKIFLWQAGFNLGGGLGLESA